MDNKEFRNRVEKAIKDKAAYRGKELDHFTIKLHHYIHIHAIKPLDGGFGTDENGEWHYENELILRGFRYVIYSDESNNIFADILESGVWTPNIVIEELVLDEETMEALITDLETII